MTEAFTRTKLSRASLYLFILSDVLTKIVQREPLNIASYYNLIFAETEEISHESNQLPLLLFDPTSIISSLINTLGEVHRKAKSKLGDMTAFRLKNPNILRGKLVNGDWVTVIAYCGGRDKKTKARCGRNPIHIGETSNCLECSYLICPSCDTCSRNCRSLVERTRPTR